MLLALALAVSPASAAVYKCKAANGGVTYQDVPCAAGTVEDVVTIVNDRAYDPPLSKEMEEAAAALRQRHKELTERLDRQRAELQQRNEEERLRAEDRSRYRPSSVTLSEPYYPDYGYVDAWPSGAYPSFPYRLRRPYPSLSQFGTDARFGFSDHRAFSSRAGRHATGGHVGTAPTQARNPSIGGHAHRQHFDGTRTFGVGMRAGTIYWDE
jgi:hypothetical protein